MPRDLFLTDESGLPPHVSGTVITVGTFDGVHRGHRDVVERLVARARTLKIPSVLVTFEPHPLEVVNPAAAPLLLTIHDEKQEVLAETGIDYLAVVPFTPRLAAYSAEHFVELILRRCFRLRELLIGYDHGFGKQRAGNVDVLKTLGERDGFRVEVVAPVSSADGHSVSSTSIRRAVAGGDLDRAAASLGRPYSVSGRVVEGERRGRTIGFPTLNLGAPPPRKLLPPEGVYAVQVQTPRGPVGGMMNLGPRPTFGDLTTSLEAHLFDTSGDFYGANVRLDFIARIRETRKFASAEQLSKQLANDERDARNALTLFGVPNNLKG
ncbi:MAG TPA: bifunctional riboflavin kinase/FAD synthetase [Gemmatimonadaceae bacterium]|jgi:riboflavin kinase/FMN adenylyltransferase|nr:bifunctional riboflavin kinase/FAD synthetase [Gemmatimonadaceae bacterium]